MERFDVFDETGKFLHLIHKDPEAAKAGGVPTEKFFDDPEEGGEGSAQFVTQGKIVEGEVENRCRGCLRTVSRWWISWRARVLLPVCRRPVSSSISGSSRQVQAWGNISRSIIPSGRRYTPFRQGLFRKNIFSSIQQPR